MRPLVLFVVGFGIVALCAPATIRASAARTSCYDKATSQTALNQCADAEARASQRRVDAAYATLQKSVTGAELHGVQVDQRAWLAYRNANCKSVSNVDLPDSGTIAPEQNLNCIAQRNEQRTAYLKWRGASLEERQNHAMP